MRDSIITILMQPFITWGGQAKAFINGLKNYVNFVVAGKHFNFKFFRDYLKQISIVATSFVVLF